MLNKLYSQFRKNILKIYGYFWPLEVNYKGIKFFLCVPRRVTFEKAIELHGAYEPPFTDKMIESLGSNDVFIDVGAGYGYHSVFATFLTKDKHIHAFDISKKALMFLQKNLRLNDRKINVTNLKVGAKNNKTTITLDTYLDNKAIINPQLIKIDVEGDELKVINGALNTIKRFKPRLLVEVHPYRISKLHRKSAFKKTLSNLNRLSNKKYHIYICLNHRGKHRGKVSGWEKVNTSKIHDYYLSYVTRKDANFALYFE